MSEHIKELQWLAANLTTYPARWRHHGTGMLQCYVSPAHRIHVWHPSLLLEGMTEGGAMHDHRFSFHSTTLAVEDGELLHSKIIDGREQRRETVTRFDVWRVPGASQGKSADLEKVGHMIGLVRPPRHLGTGDSYMLDRGEFHWARPTGLAITSCLLMDKCDTSARILTPEGVTPVHAFERTAPDEEIVYLLNRARHVLTRLAGAA